MSTKTNKIITGVLIIAVVLAIAVLVYVNLPFTTPSNTNNNNNNNTSPPPARTPILEIQLNGNTVNYTFNELQTIDSYTAQGGYRTSFPSIKGQGNYTGIRIQTLVHSLNATLQNYSIIATSYDGETTETQSFNYTVIQGNVDIYDPENASNVTPIGNGGLTMVLAHSYEGNLLNESKDGKLKVVFLDDLGSITNSGLWWKFVTTIEIVPE